jgi:hypothetical protein
MMTGPLRVVTRIDIQSLRHRVITAVLIAIQTQDFILGIRIGVDIGAGVGAGVAVELGVAIGTSSRTGIITRPPIAIQIATLVQTIARNDIATDWKIGLVAEARILREDLLRLSEPTSSFSS